MSELKQVSIYDIKNLKGEERDKATHYLLEMYEAILTIGDTYDSFADNIQNEKKLKEELDEYIKHMQKKDPDFTMTLSSYAFVRFGLLIEKMIQELKDSILNTETNEKEAIG